MQKLVSSPQNASEEEQCPWLFPHHLRLPKHPRDLTKRLVLFQYPDQTLPRVIFLVSISGNAVI